MCDLVALVSAALQHIILAYMSIKDSYARKEHMQVPVLSTTLCSVQASRGRLGTRVAGFLAEAGDALDLRRQRCQFGRRDVLVLAGNRPAVRRGRG